MYFINFRNFLLRGFNGLVFEDLSAAVLESSEKFKLTNIFKQYLNTGTSFNLELFCLLCLKNDYKPDIVKLYE